MDPRAAAAAAAGNRYGDGGGGGNPDAGSEHALATEEWLASRVLEHVADAREVCRLSLINRNFWAASFSDLVWQKRLPPKPVLDTVVPPSLNCTCPSKKDLYMHLCKSISYENGLKKFWLDPATGGECYMICARALDITWGDTPTYWEWKAWPGAMFSEVACLNSVCWFEIKGTFRQTLRPGKYMLSYRMQLHSQSAGWQRSPIKLCLQNTTDAHPPCLSQVRFDNSTFMARSCPLPHTPLGSQTTATSRLRDRAFDGSGVGSSTGRLGIPHNEHVEVEQGRLSTLMNRFGAFFLNRRLRFPRVEYRAELPALYDTTIGNDGEADWAESTLASSNWVECDAGEFLVEDDNEGRSIEVQFAMREIEVLWWKGGFVLDGVIIRPCHVAEKVMIGR